MSDKLDIIHQEAQEIIEKLLISQNYTFKSSVNFKSIEDFIKSLEPDTQVLKDTTIMSNYSIETVTPTILKFTFPIADTDSSYNIYINHSNDIPSGRIVWDYFGSGECYCNLNLVQLHSAKTSFSTLYKDYMTNSSRLGTQPTEVGLVPFAFVSSTVAPGGNFAWSFDIDTLFKYTKKLVDSPVCVYFTRKDADTNIVSPHFKFANIPNNTCSCSHPNVTSEKNKFTPCHFSSANNECPLYSPDSKIVFSQDVNPVNTNSVTGFDMSYAITSSGFHYFEILNTTDKVVVNTLKYPPSAKYEDCLEEALKIFNEYTSVYSSDSLITEVKRENASDANKDTAKSSYIESLITA